MLNANQRFLAPALAPSFYNLGLIIGAVFLTPAMGIFGLAWGAVIGALLHLGVQLPTLREIGFQWRASLAWPASWPTSWAASGAGEVFRLMAPRILGQGVTQINFWVNTTLSSGMGEGSLTALVTAFTLMFTVLGVLGQSVGTAVFPTLAMLHAQHDTEGFRRTLANALRSVLFTTIPASLGLIVLAAPLIATIYERGAWTSAATVSSAWALGFFALGLAAFGLQEILARSFYAIKDTTTPVVIAVLGVILNVVLSLALIRVVQGADPAQGAFGGLALANALATLIESIALWFLLRRRVGSLHDAEIMAMVGRVVVAALVMGAAVYSLDRALAGLPMVPMVMRLVAGALVGGAIYAGIGLLVGLPEARSVPAALLRRFRR
jgi:putative peptidoglycan lipid II flippase